MLKNTFPQDGFCFLPGNYYLNDKNIASLHDIKKAFDLQLEADGDTGRQRAYLKLEWSRGGNQIAVAEDQGYYQTKDSNTLDGGKIRQFKVMDKSILNIDIIHDLIAKNIKIVKDYPLLKKENHLTIGMHFIRYRATEEVVSTSSPLWLHQDDEPLVFIHLVNLTKNLIGGDNLIADLTGKNITRVIRLEDDMETLVLNRNVYHAVTPISARKGVAYRDVVLFTVEPSHTQMRKSA